MRYEHARVAVQIASERDVSADLVHDILGGLTVLPAEEQNLLIGTRTSASRRRLAVS